MTVYVDPSFDDDRLRAEIFGGSLVVLTGLRGVSRLVTHTRDELTRLFAPYDPEHVHEHLQPAELAVLLGEWKPRFIHSDAANELVRTVIAEAGLDPAQTHYDVPKPRTAFPLGHLNTGVAFAFPWHRDTWYSAPPQQLNWWLPVFAARPDNAMSFDLAHFARSVPNDSERFDYYAHNAVRKDTASQVTHEVQARPGAIDHTPADELVVLPAPGSVLLFSGAQLHKSIPNTSGLSRFSVDFRTVDVRDVVDRRGAPTVDVQCTGTSIRDFRNVADGGAFDERLIAEVFGRPPAGAMLTFEPAPSG